MTPLLATATFVTDFADQAVVLPLALAIGVALWASGWTRGAVAWSLTIVATFGLILGLKIGFGACGRWIGDGRIESPSGHTAAAGVIYGSILAFVAERLFGRTPVRFGVVLCVVAVVGWSRVLLGAHTVVEVVIGAVVGAGAALALVRVAGPPKRVGRLGVALLPLCLVPLLLHGTRLPAEAAIRDFASDTWMLSACRDTGTSSNDQRASMPALKALTTSRARQGLVM